MAANGRYDKRLLVQVQPGDFYLEHDAAAAWDALVAAAAAAGIRVWITSGGAYADLAAQEIRYASGASSGISVAKPGRQTHGVPDRVDVGSFGKKYGATGTVREKWLLKNAARFGWVREFGADDPNHFKYNGATTAPATGGTASITARNDDMPEYIYTDESGKGYALLDTSFPDGVIVTADEKLATHFSYLTQSTPTKGAGQWYPRAMFNARCAAALAIAQITHPKTVATMPDAKAIAGDDDEGVKEAIITAIAQAAAEINANIDDQPTTFVLTPKA